MSDLENLQLILSWFFAGAGIVAALFALRETRGIPLKAMFTTRGFKKLPKDFFRFMGLSFIAIALSALISGNQAVAASLGLMAILQFGQYSATSEDADDT